MEIAGQLVVRFYNHHCCQMILQLYTLAKEIKPRRRMGSTQKKSTAKIVYCQCVLFLFSMSLLFSAVYSICQTTLSEVRYSQYFFFLSGEFLTSSQGLVYFTCCLSLTCVSTLACLLPIPDLRVNSSLPAAYP